MNKFLSNLDFLQKCFVTSSTKTFLALDSLNKICHQCKFYQLDSFRLKIEIEAKTMPKAFHSERM